MFVLAQTTFPHDRFLHPNFSQLFRVGPKIQSISSKELIYHLALPFDRPMPLTASCGHLVPFPFADSTFAVVPAFWFFLGRNFSIFHPSDDSTLGELSPPPTPLPPKHIQTSLGRACAGAGKRSWSFAIILSPPIPSL